MKEAKTLRKWQEDAFNFFKKYKTVLFEAATGVGKTYIVSYILKNIMQSDNIRALIVVPKNVILEETWYPELVDVGISIKDIGFYYGRLKEFSKITLTNMQNIDRLDMCEFNFVIFDEVHNYQTKRMLPYISSNHKYKIGLSATVENKNGSHWPLLKCFDFNHFKYDLSQALKDDVINRYNFVNVGVELDSMTRVTYDNLQGEICRLEAIKRSGKFSKEQNLGYLKLLGERKSLLSNYHKKFEALKDICSAHKLEGLGGKFIIFNEYNDSNNRCKWIMTDIGLKPCIVNSNIDRDQVTQNLLDFKLNKYDAIVTSRMLDEGYNLPTIDVSIILSGNSTDRQTIQRAGRVLRKKDDESYLYQVYCIDTVEERYAKKRSEILKKYCIDYSEVNL